MGVFVLALLLFHFGSIRYTESSTCQAQCDYDHVTHSADCSSRGLNCIPSNYPNAVYMNLSHNNISILEPNDFNGTFTRLRELYLDFNNISDVTSLMQSTKIGTLQTLSVQHNVISTLSGQCQLSSLENLIMDHNLLTNIGNFRNCDALKHLSANFNELKGYLSIRVYSSISLQFNGITYFRYYVSSLAVPQNTSLLVDHNEIHTVYIIARSTNVVKLSLSHNKLRYVNVRLSSLPTELTVASNGLFNWNGFRFYTSKDGMMMKLDMRNNSFDSLIEPNWAEGLQIIQADDNILANLSSTTLQGFVNLTELHVANNRLLFISSSALSQLTMLRSLHLDGNALTSLLGGVFLNQAELVELSINNNKLSVLHSDYFLGLEALERLYLAGNRLLQVNSGMFQHVPGIVSIDFSQNEIQVFDLINCSNILSHLRHFLLVNNSIQDVTEVLGHCDSLDFLDLSFNEIEVVPGDALAGRNRKLSRLELEGNPLQCDCRLTGLRDWLANNPPSALPRCAGPPRHSGKEVTDLSTADLSCDPPEVMTNVDHLEVVVGQTAIISCTATGTPAPKLTWLDPNDTVISDDWLGRFWISRDMTLHIVSVRADDQGIYTCLARNVLEEMDRVAVTLTVVEDFTFLVVSVLPTMFGTLIVTLMVVFVAIILRRRRIRRNQARQETPGQQTQVTVAFQKDNPDSPSERGQVNKALDSSYINVSQSQTTEPAVAYEVAAAVIDSSRMPRTPRPAETDYDEAYEQIVAAPQH